MATDSIPNPYASPANSTVEPVSNFRQDANGDWTFDYETTPTDLEAFALHHYLSTPIARRQYIHQWISLTITLVIIGLLLLFTLSPLLAAGVLAAGLFFAVAFPRLYRQRVRKLAEMMRSGGRNVGLLGPHQLRFSPNGLYYRSDAGESLLYWHGIERLDADNDYAYIYLSANSAIVVARREFTDPADFPAFVARMEQTLAEHRSRLAE